MNRFQEIIHLKNREIEYEKWDRCIANASNSTLYAKSWYLDIVSPNWEAFILGDYEFVMPLPVKRKYGIKMVAQPLHCQQLGIFPVPSIDIQQKFRWLLINSFKIVRYQLNSGMCQNVYSEFIQQKRKNYILPLNNSCESIREYYSKNTCRNIKKSEKQQVKVIKGLLPDEFFQLKRESIKWKVPERSYAILKYLMAKTISNGRGTIYAAYSKSNSLCAAAFILFEKNKAYYLNAFSTDEGKENRAMYAIVEALIREFCGSDMKLDFEGSMIEGVARFYRGFGAVQEEYFYLQSNRIPFIGKNN